MKILFDYQIFFLQKYGGISNYFFNLVNELNKKKIENKIYAPLYINEYIKSLKAKNIFGLKLNFNYFKINSIVNKLFFNFFLEKYNPDILHLSYYENYDFKNNSNQKNILTVYDMIHEEYCINFKKDETSLKKFNSCKKADHIIAISKITKKKLIEFFKISPEKISVTYLGGDHMKNIKPLKIDIRKKFILYVGSRAGYKNFGKLISAYYLNNKISKDYDLIVFGGEKISRTEMNMYKKKFKIIDNVKFIHSNDQVLKFLYKKASLFVYPSLQEGFGIPPIEAIFNNCPVACSNIPVFKEILGNSCFYFNPHNVRDINITLHKILNSPKYGKKLLKHKNKIKKKFTWSKCAFETIKIYKKVLNEKN